MPSTKREGTLYSSDRFLFVVHLFVIVPRRLPCQISSNKTNQRVRLSTSMAALSNIAADWKRETTKGAKPFKRCRRLPHIRTDRLPLSVSSSIPPRVWRLIDSHRWWILSIIKTLCLSLAICVVLFINGDIVNAVAIDTISVPITRYCQSD
jgi:hypothetical protein